MISQYFETSNRRWWITSLWLFLLVVFAFLLSLSFGSVKIPPDQLLVILTGGTAEKTVWSSIVWEFRLPKALTAAMAGSALGLSGLQMQTLFRNPLAGPFILGISSGASLGVSLIIFGGVSLGTFSLLSTLGLNSLLVIGAALGGFLVLVVISIAAFRVKSSVSLLIIGLMFASATSALVSILQYFSKSEYIQAYVFWTFGSLGSLSWSELSLFIPLISVGSLGALLLSKPLNAWSMGENYAGSIGLNIRQTRLLIILNTSILAGTVTAFCGPLAFVGLAVPHLARLFFNTSNHLHLSPMVIFIGAAALLFFDLLAQLPGLAETLPLNAVTSLIGAPFVIWLIIRKNNLHYSFDG